MNSDIRALLGSPPTPSWTSKSLGLFLVGIAYYLGAEAAFLIGTLSDRIFAPFWPPNIVLFCALILVPYRRWPHYIIAVFPFHVVAELEVGMDWPHLLVAFATNAMVAVLSAAGIRHFLIEPPWFGSFHKAVSYVIIAAVVSPAIAAFGGAFVRIAGADDLARYWIYWEQWYFANALASVTLGAAFLSWAPGDADWSDFGSRRQQGGALLLAAGLVAACVVAFRTDFLIRPSFLPALLYLPMPLILLATVRYRAKGASAAILIVTIASISLTLHGPTVFVGAEAEDNVLALQVFLTALSVPALLLAASIDGLRRAERTMASLARLVLGERDDERHKIATSLHESIGQNLVVAAWIAEQLQAKLTVADQPTAKQLEAMLLQSLRDVREISYLLHPPLLDEGGLEPALRVLIEEHSQNSALAVSLELSPTLGRLPRHVELTVFRVAEEALANVRRHSANKVALVSIDSEGDPDRKSVVLTVENASAGMPRMAELVTSVQKAIATRSAGLGLAGMRERLGRIGGKLEFKSTSGKTIVKATIPMRDALP